MSFLSLLRCLDVLETMDADFRRKALAGGSLVLVQTTVGLLYKVSQAASGGFRYSTMSAVAIAEFIKLILSSMFHVHDKANIVRDGETAVSAAWRTATESLSQRAVLYIWVLALLYTFNNQLSFYVYTMADPGTIYLFKGAATMITASIQCAFVGKTFSKEQWKAMFLQGIGMVVVQYNPCKGRGMYPLSAYLLMALSTVVSALCAVCNEYLVKNYKIGLNVQNAVLYLGGTWMNILAFLILPNPNSQQADIGFFDGYSNPLALGVVACNALIGLAITAVYKYADAIIKCIASDLTAVVLCILSAAFFGLESSVTMWCGVIVVCLAVHMYTEASQRPPMQESKSSPEPRQLETRMGKDSDTDPDA